MIRPIPITFPTNDTCPTTIYWNNSLDCFDKDVSKLKLIASKSDIYLPIQFMNNLLCIYNDNQKGESINIYLPTSSTEYGVSLNITPGNVMYVQYLFNTYPLFVWSTKD